MAEKLSEEIIGTLLRYYEHRKNQAVMDYSGGSLIERKWDKEADLDVIFEAAKKEGWAVESCAGTFWFSKKVLTGKHVIKVKESTVMQGGESNILAPGEPLGVFAMLDRVLERRGRMDEPRK